MNTVFFITHLTMLWPLAFLDYNLTLMFFETVQTQ